MKKKVLFSSMVSTVVLESHSYTDMRTAKCTSNLHPSLGSYALTQNIFNK